jgi:hypothetical protein
MLFGFLRCQTTQNSSLQIQASVMTTNLNPRVGVTAIIVKQNKYVLIGKRKGSHGAETIQTPGYNHRSI